ncbi:MAG: amidohydrolase family protein [Verrucomicrobiota bacterium]
MNRRQFLHASAVSGLSLAGALAAEPPLTIIDTHTHFYDPTRAEGVPWPQKSDALLYRKVMPQDYLALKTPQPVTGTVVVEASAWVEDNQWILDLAAKNPFITGFVGNLKPGEDGFGANLKRFAANRLYRGIRVNGNVIKAKVGDAAFLADLKQLAALDLELDINGPAATLPAIAQLAQAIPDLRIVINHLSNTRIDGKNVEDAWRRDMQAAAKHQNVNAKVSGLVEGTGRKDGSAPKDAAFYAPWLDVMWEAFGEDRLIYGSNWPVSERFAPLATVQGIVTDYFTAKGRSALEKCFAGNAARVYKWVKR